MPYRFKVYVQAQGKMDHIKYVAPLVCMLEAWSILALLVLLARDFENSPPQSDKRRLILPSLLLL